MTARPKLAAFKPTSAAPAATAAPATKPVGSGDTIQTSFRLTSGQWHKLHEAALTERVPVKTLMIAALHEYFEKRGLRFDA